jgi:hypothetical protein
MKEISELPIDTLRLLRNELDKGLITRENITERLRETIALLGNDEMIGGKRNPMRDILHQLQIDEDKGENKDKDQNYQRRVVSLIYSLTDDPGVAALNASEETLIPTVIPTDLWDDVYQRMKAMYPPNTVISVAQLLNDFLKVIQECKYPLNVQ